jgi:hypothetical protein
MTNTVFTPRHRVGLARPIAIAAVSLVLFLPVLGAAGAVHADEIVETPAPSELVELAEPTDPIEPTDLVEPAEESEPTDATEPAEPVELVELQEVPQQLAAPADPIPAPNVLDPASITAATDFVSASWATSIDFPLADLFYNDSDPAALLYEINDPAGKISVNGEYISFDTTGSCVCDKSFEYRTHSGATISNWATVHIEITATGTAPVAYGDSYSVVSGDSLNVIAPGVLSNDVLAPNGGVWTSSAQGGESALYGNGNLNYTPPAGFVGQKKIYYQLHDANGFSNWATIFITVTPKPAPSGPVASGDEYTTPMNTTLHVAAPGVLVNDSAGTVNSLGGFYPGIAALDPTGAFSYEPPVGFTGTVYVEYTIINNGIVSAPASIEITVTVPVGTVITPTDPRDPGTPSDDPGLPGGSDSTIPAEIPTGDLAHAGASSAWLIPPALGLLAAGVLAAGFSAHRRRQFAAE